MKNILILIFNIMMFYTYSQNTNTKTIFIKNLNVYNENEFNNIVYFNIKSVDKRFNHDVYFFKVQDNIDNAFKKRPIKNIGKEINLDTINYITPSFFEGKRACDTHVFLSIVATKGLRIISEVNNNNNNNASKYLVWNVIYYGTMKDFVFTNFGKL